MQDLEFVIEYFPNPDEGEQAEHITETEFVGLIAAHEYRGLQPILSYDVFTVFGNGRNGRRLTIRDEWGVYYG